MNRTAVTAASAVLAASAAAAEPPAQLAAAQLPREEIVVTGERIDTAVPTTMESVTADVIANTINVTTPEDTLKYLPNIMIRQRHIGDTQSPITTRTSGVGASARSLIYVDGVLISALIGNNNSTASPKWGLVAPDAIDRVDVMYGPFSAAYAGNSMGTVVSFTTRMPDRLEIGAEAQGALQWFSKYGEDGSYGTARFAGDIGDRFGDVAFRLSYNHLDNHGQPLSYATATAPASASGSGTAVTGAFNDRSRSNTPIFVLGATGIEHQIQDNVSGRAAWDATPAVTAAYTFGLFRNDDASTVDTYLRDGSGQPVYAGMLNIGGRAISIAPNAFSNGVYQLDELQLAQGLSLASHDGGAFDFELVGSTFNTVESHQRVPGIALPAAFSGGAGSSSNLDGTGWYTLDGKAIWRPLDTQEITIGAHEDRFKLKNPRYGLADWVDGTAGPLLNASTGKTRTDALWAQDLWTITPALKATLGLRYEHWKAYDGFNFSAAPALDVHQPELSHEAVSPKAVIAFAPSAGWLFKASGGFASRFPTVTELYQAITTGVTLSVPNPTLKPERAFSSELSAERSWQDGSVRLSVFDERMKNALLSQTAPLPPGSTTLASYVQNVDRTHATGVELVGRQVVAPGLELSGWITYVNARIDRDAVFPSAVGKNLPQLPRLRGSIVATYAPAERFAVTLAARYSDKAFATIDNSDSHADTYQGFDAYFVMDAHVRYQLTAHFAADIGINNINGRAYFLFHPFPQRTLVADVKYTY
jgi:iron complex outermembrane receptor protein